jgi:hypothetical protein
MSFRDNGQYNLAEKIEGEDLELAKSLYIASPTATDFIPKISEKAAHTGQVSILE